MGLLVAGVGSPLTLSPASGGKVYAFNALDDTTPTMVAPANVYRQRILFFNPGDVDVLIFPAEQQTTGSDTPLNATVAARGGTFLIYGNGGSMKIEGECQGEWMALAASGSGKPLTVMDSNT